MIPDLKGTASLDLTDNSIGSTNAVVGGLKDGRNTVRYWDGEYEEVAEPELEGAI